MNHSSTSDDLSTKFTDKKYVYQIPAIKLEGNQKTVINKLIKELEDSTCKDVQEFMDQPRIQKMLKYEFNLNQQEIKQLEHTIQQYSQNASSQKHPQSARESFKIQMGKQQPLSILQRKEFDHFLELDYSQFPVQPCVKSLYYISKLAQTQQLRIIVPPTILIGFGDDNRMLSNCDKTGNLIVKAGYISPKIISNFINKQMSNIYPHQTIEEKLLFPKYVIKLASKNTTTNEVKLYYSKEALMSDVLAFWGSYDIAIQMFIKQKHMRPSIYRYYMKNGNVYKAVSISNQENMSKESRLYKVMTGLIQEQKDQQKIYVPREKSQTRRESILGQRTPRIEKSPHDNPKDPLQGFKYGDLFSSYHTNISAQEFKKYFCISADNIDNLSMMNCRPSCQPFAEKMTQDLYRLFTQYYLQIKKFGNISQFVCDFMEDENGLLYLLQVKSFECEGIKYDWQVCKIPTTTQGAFHGIKEKETIQQQEINLQNECQAQILCRSENFKELRKYFKQACIECEQWIFSHKSGTVPKINERYVNKYKLEMFNGKDNFILQSEKNKISPLYPLTTFTENRQILSPKMRRSSIIQEEVSTIEEVYGDVPCCLYCIKAMEFFQQRYYALVFKTEQTRDELRKLKLRLFTQWSYENVLFLISIYKDSKQRLNIVTDIERQQKLVRIKEMKVRAKSPDSVAIKSLRRSSQSHSRLVPQSRMMFLRSRQSMCQDSLKGILNQDMTTVQAPQTERSRSRIHSARILLKSRSQTNHGCSRQSTMNQNPKLQHYTIDETTYNLFSNETMNKLGVGADQSPLTGHAQSQTPNDQQKLSDVGMIQSTFTKHEGYQKLLKNNVNDKELGTLIAKYNLKIKSNQQRQVIKTRNLIDPSEIAYIQNKDLESKSYVDTQERRVDDDDKIQNTIQMLGERAKKRMQNNTVNEYFNAKRMIRTTQDKFNLSSQKFFQRDISPYAKKQQ